jgi:ubiquinol-cytochrome c reductase cytochrome b subunit
MIQKRTFHANVKASKRIGPHDKDVVSVVIGSLLGNCICEKLAGNTRFVFIQGIENKEFIFWLYDFFYMRGYCLKIEPVLKTKSVKDLGIGGVGRQLHKPVVLCRPSRLLLENKKYSIYKFNTFYFRSFNWIHKMFYKDGKKYISLKLESYLTPLALAVWIMSDGKFVNGGVQLSTYFHTSQDINKLITMLRNRFGLICCMYEPKKGLYIIVISKESVKLLQTIVLPYIQPTMKHKIGLHTSSTLSSF